jgi:hypothetical protein
MKRKEDLQVLDDKHFDRLWKIIPVGSPLHSIGADALREFIFPIDRHTLIQIDPTRKHPYSLVFAEYFSPHTDVFFKEKIDEHQIWLLKNNSDAFKVFQKQLEKCESNLACPDARAKEVADIIEYHQNAIGGQTSREAVREIARVDNPKLLPKDTTIENRDLFDRVEKIYEKTRKSKAGRPRQK